MAELADALGSGPSECKFMWVRLPSSAPIGSIAQLGEHLPYKQGVTGSSPVVPTMKKPLLSIKTREVFSMISVSDRTDDISSI